MQRFNLKELIEYNDSKFNAKVLINEAGHRMVLLNLRKGQSVPGHANQAIVTVYALAGHITFYGGADSCELREGEVVRLDAGIPHRIEAHEDSTLYVVAAGQANASVATTEELDLREVPRPLRHPLVFEKLDGLTLGDSFVLVNDHDPVPLSRQIDGMRQGQATWEYIQRGPDLFRIRIRRVAPSSASEIPFHAQSGTSVTVIGRS